MKRIAAKYLYSGLDLNPIENAFVEFEEDGTIVSVGRTDKPENEPVYYDGIVMPGFVNSHCHLELSHLKGRFVKGTGMAGFIDQINALRDSKSRECKIEEASEWLDLLWKRGVSAMADISNCNDTFRMKSESPLYTRTFLEVFGTEPEDCESVISSVRKLNEEADAAGIDAAPTPHSCYTMSPELLSASSAEALKAGWLSYHSQESMEEEDFIKDGSGALADNRRRAGMSIPEPTGKPSLMYFIDRLCKVHPAPFEENILLVHNVCLTQEAVDAAKSVFKNVYWAVCPLSNMFIHNALPPFDLMRKNNLTITVGTDSLSSNDDLDMIKELYCIQKHCPDISLGEIIIWATDNGAKFLGKTSELGAIEVSRRPGLVFVSDVDAAGRLTEKSRSERIF